MVEIWSQRVEDNRTADFAVSTQFFNLLAFQMYLELRVQISHGFRTSWLLCLVSSFLVSGCYKADNKLTVLVQHLLFFNILLHAN